MKRPGQGPAGARGGTTLVEVIIGCLILAVLALAAMASLQYTRSMTVQQRDHRTALELANGRLEALRGAPFNTVRPTSSNYNVYYLRASGTTWVVSSAVTNENVTVNYRPRPMRTTVQYVDADGGSASYDLLKFNVRVQYSSSASNQVELETMRGP